MNKYLPAACAVLLVIPLSGCGRESHESLRKQQIKTVQEAADVVNTVKDKASADSATPQLKKLSERWRDLAKRRDALPKAAPDEEAKLKAKYDDELTNAGVRLVTGAISLNVVSGGKETLAEANDLLGGCAHDVRDSLRRQQIQTAKEAADLLTTIKDKPSADAARTQLKKLGDHWRDLEKCVDVLPKATAEEDAELKRKYEDEFNGARFRVVGEAMRVSIVPGGKEALLEVGDLKKR